MPSIFDVTMREAFQNRIRRLAPGAQAVWGRMSAHQMVCHLGDQLRIALGELPSRPIAGPLLHTPIKQLVIDVLPWPKGTKSAPELFTTQPAEWERDVTTLRELLDQFGARANQPAWPSYPIFGQMSGPLWGRLICRHFDHHLRQFGV